MRIELFSSPGCPNVDAARKLVDECLATLGIQAPVFERVGHYLSPTVLVDGVDVMRPEASALVGDACRLDLPTPQRVLDVLRAKAAHQIEPMGRQSAGRALSV